jgi:uncharacterized protein
MSGEDNKKLVRSYFKAVEAGDLNELARITTDDFTFWVAPTTIVSGTYSKEKWLQLVSGLLADMAGPMTQTPDELTAEDDRVSATAIGSIPFKSGKTYSSHYHYLFFVRDGKISEIKEYLDTYHVGEVFGFPNAAV